MPPGIFGGIPGSGWRRRGGLAPPVNSVAPVFAIGTAAPSIGGTSTITPGTWSGGPTLTYTLRRGGVSVGGATNLSLAAAQAYTFVAADIGPSLVWRETATNAAGSATADSNAKQYTIDAALGSARGWHFDPADLNSSPVSAWADRSSNGINLAQGTGSKQPTWNATAGPNNQPAVTGDGVNDTLVSAAISPTFAQPYSVFLVVKNITWVSGQRILTVAGNQLIINQFNTTPAMELFTGTAFACKNSDLAVNTWGLLEARANGGSSSTTVNAGTSVTGSPGTASIHGQTLNVLGDDNSATYANAALALILMVTHDPTASERADLRAYSTWRFGFP